MINFILCDDEKTFSDNLYSIIIKFLMNYDIEYKFYVFSEYNKNFEEVVKKDIGFKVYLLDIETKSSSGLDAARMIREEYDDWTSIIIVVTSHEEYRYSALSARLQLLDFINKLDNCDNYIKDDLEKCIKIYDNRPKTLKIKSYNVFSLVEYKNIICIEKEQDSKKCVIKTTYGDKVYHGPLNKVLLELNDNRFLKIHRSLIINIDYIDKYDIKENKLTFKDGSYTFLVARGKKKELLKYVTINN